MAAGAAVRALLASLAAVAMAPGLASAATFAFDSTPPAQSNQIAPTFAYHGPDASSTFSCKLDNGSTVNSCPSPHALSGLSEGAHTFTVQITNATTGTPPPPISYTWTVDLTPPTTQITSRPSAISNVTTSTFTFSSPDPTATFRCTLNGGAPSACTSPLSYTGLSDATRSLLIQAVDPAGNVDPLAQPLTWSVDTTPPDTTLASTGNLTGRQVVEFSFTSSEAGSTFQCSFRNAAFAPCTSPDPVDIPHSGSQLFKVRAVDAAGNVDLSPATRAWTSDLTPPERPTVTIFAAPTAAKATVSAVGPRPVATNNPSLGLTFTNPLQHLLSTARWQESVRLHAQWSSDSTAHSYDVTVDEFPMDSTGMGFHGEDLDTHTEYRHTTRTALTLHVFFGSTACVKVTASDKVGNVSRARTSCTSIPVSFTPRDIGPPPTKDAKAFRGYYVVLGAKGYEFVQDIGDEFYFSPTHVALIAERCRDCGVVEVDFNRFVGNPQNRNHELATVDLNASDRSGDFHLIDVPLPARRVARYGMGDLVIRAVSGRPRISGIGVSN